MRFKKILLLVGLTPLAVSCSLATAYTWDKYANDDYSMGLSSAKYKAYKVSTDFSKLDKYKRNLEEVVTNKGSYSTFLRIYNLVYEEYNSLYNDITFAEMQYDEHPSEETKAVYDAVYNKYNERKTFFYELEKKIAVSSSEIKIAYFGDISDEEIQKQINESGTASQATTYYTNINNIQNESAELLSSYRNKTITEDEYISQGVDLYWDYLTNVEEIKKLYNIDNYLENLYKYDFGRDYTIEDALKFASLVKKHILPIYSEKSSLSYPDDIDQDFIKKLREYNFCNATTKTYKYVKDYADYLGGDYLKRYNYVWRNGYYCFSDDENSLGTAYTTPVFDSYFNLVDYALYYSSSYQDVTSLLHEFGHYFAFTSNSDNPYMPYDILETHSQGNEYLFLNYLVENTSDDEHADEYECFADRCVYNNLFYLINESVITEIENFAFSAKDLTKDSLKQGIQDILDTYEGSASKYYWVYPVVNSAGYYISYATSVVESLQLFNYKTDYSKEIYLNLVANPHTYNSLSTWEGNGFDSPFEEDTFENLATLFKEISEKY